MKQRPKRISAKKRKTSRPNKIEKKRRSANERNFVRLEHVRKERRSPNRGDSKKRRESKRKELVQRELLIELLSELLKSVPSNRLRKSPPRTRKQRPRVLTASNAVP